MKYRKIVVFVVIIAILSYLLLVFNPITTNTSFAADMSAGTLSRDINGIDENLYPGYKQLINNLKSKHSNYTFLVYYTGMDWNEVLTAEYQGHGKSPKNLFQIGTNYNGMWVCPLCGTQKYDNGSWCCASLESLAYMMDPRNSINESDVFQFKDLQASDVTYEDIARVVSGYGEYINNQEVVQAIVDASKEHNINGYFLVAKIINEHGKNGSTLSSGNGYNGNYVGVYNYFNIGSYGNGTATIINNGLSYALNKGWTSRRASIFGGAAEVKESFINKYSQNTVYYQKFNVSGRSTMASHQYQQNIMAAQSQGSSLKAYYNNSTTVQHTFLIPLYKNMPKTACSRPSVTTVNKITYENGVVQNINSSLKIRASENGTIIDALNNNESIKILKRGTTTVGGYIWDLIVSNKTGAYGYAARSTGSEQHIVSNGTTGTSSGSIGTAEPNDDVVTPPTPPTTEEKPSIDLEKHIQINDKYMNTLPNITYENIKTKYKDAVIKNSKGENVTSGNLGTGYTVTVGENTYKVVKKGDTNGDGNITIVDAVVMLNSIKGTLKLENEFAEAAAVKNGETFNVTDTILLLNYIKGTASFTL